MFQEKSFLKLFLLSFLFTLLTVLSFPAAVTAAQLTLSWSDNSTNEDGFRIERRTGTTGTYAEIAALGVNAASYTDVNLANGTTYCYRVRAYNAGEASGYSNEQCATTSVATSYALTVAKSGTGGGVVTATGINCGTDCSELYASGTSVTLTAIPAGGSSFAGWSGTGWSGSGCPDTAGCTMTISSNTAVTATFVNNQADKVGIYRPSTGEWFLDQNGNGTWDGCSADKCVEYFTTDGALPVVGKPVVGKWNGSETTRLGLFFPATAQWRLDINSDEILGDCGVDPCLGPFGEATDIPVAGKWSSAGYDRIGVFRPSNERWYMDVNGNGSLNSCSKDRCASLSIGMGIYR
jgi:Divergent InlB B-repeat domain/Fibronectin type III domain